jgi:hypothetical protein
MKLTIGDIEEHRLATAPLKVGANKEDDPDRRRQPLDFPPIPAHALGMDGFIAGIQVPMYRLFIQLIDSFISG